jgi:lactobin A/cerein 7B family class IIb bacteriocin
MNEHAFRAADIGVALTDQEMGNVEGGDGTIAHAIGYCIGFFAAMVVQTAICPEMQQYCFGA